MRDLNLSHNEVKGSFSSVGLSMSLTRHNLVRTTCGLVVDLSDCIWQFEELTKTNRGGMHKKNQTDWVNLEPSKILHMLQTSRSGIA